MKKEKFIKKILKETYDEAYFEFSSFVVERQLIEKAMKYRNWGMFFWGMVVGEIYIILIYLFIK